MSEKAYATILEIERTLFYDLRNFFLSDVDNLSISELHYLLLTSKHKSKKDETSNTPQIPKFKNINEAFEKMIGGDSKNTLNSEQ